MKFAFLVQGTTLQQATAGGQPATAENVEEPMPAQLSLANIVLPASSRDEASHQADTSHAPVSLVLPTFHHTINYHKTSP